MEFEKTPRENKPVEPKKFATPANGPSGFADESEPSWAPPEHQPEQTSVEPVMKPAPNSPPKTPSPT